VSPHSIITHLLLRLYYIFINLLLILLLLLLYQSLKYPVISVTSFPRCKKFGFLNILISPPFYSNRAIYIILNDLYILNIKRSSINIILIIVIIIIIILKSYIAI
jgi:hypothetical protein